MESVLSRGHGKRRGHHTGTITTRVPRGGALAGGDYAGRGVAGVDGADVFGSGQGSAGKNCPAAVPSMTCAWLRATDDSAAT